MALGFVFPGQGSQAVGMLADHIRAEPVVAECFAAADQVLGVPLTRIALDGPEADLNRTEITQPAILTASVALWRLWQARGGATPAVMAGHSLGEYSALVCAGALDFDAAVMLVHERGRCMQAAVPEGVGAMAAVLGLDDADVAKCCEAVAGVVAPANFNAPGQVVIAGESAAVDEAIAACQAAGARRAMTLAVSVPSHCTLMTPAAEDFATKLAAVELRLPRVAVVHNVDAMISDSIEALRDRLLRQLSEPVQWTACVQRMVASGARELVECGPGRVLSGLIKRIDRDVRVSAIDSPAALASALESKAS